MALALLSLCAKLHERHPPKVRTLAKIVHPSHQDIDLNVLENGEGRKEHVLRGRNVGSLGELEEEIKEWEGKIMVWLRWKLAVPLLYDEVLALTDQWDHHTAFLKDFPLHFTNNPLLDPYSADNHNHLASQTCICLYNLTHLLTSTSFELISNTIRRLSLAIFLVLISTYSII